MNEFQKKDKGKC